MNPSWKSVQNASLSSRRNNFLDHGWSFPFVNLVPLQPPQSHVWKHETKVLQMILLPTQANHLEPISSNFDDQLLQAFVTLQRVFVKGPGSLCKKTKTFISFTILRHFGNIEGIRPRSLPGGQIRAGHLGMHHLLAVSLHGWIFSQKISQ